jgi:hypothetical protein
MARELPEYANWIRRQPCAACGGPGPCEVHHSTVGETHAPGDRPEKALPGKRGKSQRAHDYYAIALHIRCHAQLHTLSGFFRGWTGEQLAAWQREQVQAHRERYEAETGRHAGAGLVAPPVAPLVANDPRAVALEFCRERGLGEQVAFDLERLLRSYERTAF